MASYLPTRHRGRARVVRRLLLCAPPPLAGEKFAEARCFPPRGVSAVLYCMIARPRCLVGRYDATGVLLKVLGPYFLYTFVLLPLPWLALGTSLLPPEGSRGPQPILAPSPPRPLASLGLPSQTLNLL